MIKVLNKFYCSRSARKIAPRLQKKLLETSEEEEEEGEARLNRAGGKLRGSGSASGSRSEKIFSGLSFILNRPTARQARPGSEREDSEGEEEEVGEVGEGDGFDKKSLREAIESQGGRVLAEFPLHHTASWNVSTLETTVICLSPGPSKTMTYLLCLAHGVPLLSHRFVLDSVRLNRLADRSSYLLPAGFSSLLMREVEQEQDNTEELRLNECLLPLAPANRTRQSRRAKEEEEQSGGSRRILSGLHVLVISQDQNFTQDWQSVLDSLGASVTVRHRAADRLSQIRVPDVAVTDSQAPANICKVRQWGITSPADL